jgi:hypothetical protein
MTALNPPSLILLFGLLMASIVLWRFGSELRFYSKSNWDFSKHNPNVYAPKTSPTRASKNNQLRLLVIHPVVILIWGILCYVSIRKTIDSGQLVSGIFTAYFLLFEAIIVFIWIRNIKKSLDTSKNRHQNIHSNVSCERKTNEIIRANKSRLFVVYPSFILVAVGLCCIAVMDLFQII